MIAGVINLNQSDNLKIICWLLSHTLSKSKSKSTSGKKKRKLKNTVEKEQQKILEIMSDGVINWNQRDNLKIICWLLNHTVSKSYFKLT